jgi:hypothetical protein
MHGSRGRTDQCVDIGDDHLRYGSNATIGKGSNEILQPVAVPASIDSSNQYLITC